MAGDLRCARPRSLPPFLPWRFCLWLGSLASKPAPRPNKLMKSGATALRPPAAFGIFRSPVDQGNKTGLIPYLSAPPLAVAFNFRRTVCWEHRWLQGHNYAVRRTRRIQSARCATTCRPPIPLSCEGVWV